MQTPVQGSYMWTIIIITTIRLLHLLDADLATGDMTGDARHHLLQDVVPATGDTIRGVLLLLLQDVVLATGDMIEGVRLLHLHATDVNSLD